MNLYITKNLFTAMMLVIVVSTTFFVMFASYVFASQNSRIASTYPTPNDAVKLVCPWECGESFWFPQGYYIVKEMCTKPELFLGDLAADGRGNDVYAKFKAGNVTDNVAWDGLWNWHRYKITTGIGWSGWWVGLANYCVENKFWKNSTAASVTNRAEQTLTFVVSSATEDAYTAKLLEKSKVNLRMQGSNKPVEDKTFVSPSFNSPFIYFKNFQDGAYRINIKTDGFSFQNVEPNFTDATGWDIDVRNQNISTNGQEIKHLYYEVNPSQITLTRNGKNFSSRDELIHFLNESDFFDNLLFTQEEKNNSLAYILPRIGNAKNYYLTILDRATVEEISQVEVIPQPEHVDRVYYAIYPTQNKVAVYGDLLYPERMIDNKSRVQEYGELIVDSSLYVFWK